MEWLGLPWDEGPYMQSAGFEQHQTAALRLLKSGQAYPLLLFLKLLVRRKEAANNKQTRAESNPLTPRRRQLAEKGKQAAVRFKLPDGPCRFAMQWLAKLPFPAT